MRTLTGLAMLSVAVSAHAAAPKTPAADFAALDLDKSAALDWNEYRNRVSEIFFFADANSDGRVDASEAEALGTPIQAADADADGAISHAEWLDVHRKQFAKLDRDGDARLSLSEATGG